MPRQPQPVRGPLVTAVLKAQRDYLRLRREGVKPCHAAEEIAPGLRAALGRGEGWRRERCEACGDTGWAEVAVDVGHVYGPDEPVKWAVRKCVACGYWQARWAEAVHERKRRSGGEDVSEDDPVSSVRTRRGRR